MKCSRRSFAAVSLLFAVFLSLTSGALNARDADLASRTFAAAQTAKQQCTNTCRARYNDCRRLKQLPLSEIALLSVEALLTGDRIMLCFMSPDVAHQRPVEPTK